MRMKAIRPCWFALSLALGLGVGLLILTLPREAARAGDPGGSGVPQDVLVPTVAVSGVSTFAASSSFDVGPLSLVGSSVEMTECYQEDKKQTLCFTVYNGSTDGEWVDIVRLDFPDDPDPLIPAWIVDASSYEDPTDSVGYAVNFTHTISGKQIEYRTSDSDGFGEISNGASWMACIDVTVPPNYDGPRLIPWELEGDTTSGVGASGSIGIEKCTPLTLKPSQVVITGCNGVTQTLEFELRNYDAGSVALDFTYDAPEANFTGYHPSSIQSGEIITFLAELKPNLCLEPGEQIHASLTVEAPGVPADTSVVTQTITESGGWHRLDDSPIPAMDNAVIWANQGDGGLWSIGGYGSGGAAQRYDPSTGEWLTYTNPLTPVIEYPMDGCYGLNGDGDEIIVLFPDTIVTGTLQIWNITRKNWYTEPVPASGYPEEGRWGQDIVSMLQHTGENVCYLSGGSPQTGGGRTKDLWEYHPFTGAASYIGPFTDTVPPYTETPVFNFHASWYVPWVGDAGAICVAGGVDYNHQIITSTQCYDLHTGQFNERNADLGGLPEPWWGMADGWQITNEGYELWIANGVAQDGTLLPVSAYFREGTSSSEGFKYGPPIPHDLYRLEGDAWEDQFYTLNGSRGGFWYSEFSLHLASCPTCYEVFLPLTLRDYQ